MLFLYLPIQYSKIYNHKGSEIKNTGKSSLVADSLAALWTRFQPSPEDCWPPVVVPVDFDIPLVVTEAGSVPLLT
jgi:hypothetical protein